MFNNSNNNNDDDDYYKRYFHMKKYFVLYLYSKIFRYVLQFISLMLQYYQTILVLYYYSRHINSITIINKNYNI